MIKSEIIDLHEARNTKYLTDQRKIAFIGVEMDKIIEHWVERSQYDLDTAKIILDTGRYLYVAYICQQTVEKVLKALIARE